MKKFILVAGLALATVLALASCGEKYSFTCESSLEQLDIKLVMEANADGFTKFELTGEDKDSLETTVSSTLELQNEKFKEQDVKMKDYFSAIEKLMKDTLQC